MICRFVGLKVLKEFCRYAIRSQVSYFCLVSCGCALIFFHCNRVIPAGKGYDIDLGVILQVPVGLRRLLGVAPLLVVKVLCCLGELLVLLGCVSGLRDVWRKGWV